MVGYTYRASGEIATVTDALGNVTQYGYDAAGRRTSVTQPDPDGAGSQTAPVTVYTFDNLGRVTQVTNALSNATSFEYDSRDRRIKQTDADPDGGGPLTSPIRSWTYNVGGQLTSQIDPLGRTTSYTYDLVGNILTVTLPDPDDSGPLTAPTTMYAYDNLYRRTSITDALGNVTAFAYSSMDRLTQETAADPDGGGPLTSPVTSHVYDAAGQLASTTDPLGHITAYEYDGLGRRVAATQQPAGGGSAVQILDDGDAGFGTAGSWVLHASGYQSDVRYSAKGTGADTATWTFDGLTAGTYRIAATWPPHSNRATDSPYTIFDGSTALGTVDVNQEVAPNDFSDAGASWEILGEFTITGDTLVVQLSDNANEYVIADAIRIERLDPTIRWTYDAVGNLLTETDPLGHTTTHAYDNLYRLTATTDASNGTTQRAYDAVGRVTSLTDAVNNTTTFAYDNLGRRVSETNALSATRTFVYDAVGNLTKVTDRNGRIREFTYDALGRQTQEKWLTGTTVVNTIVFSYDAAGQLLNASDSNSSYAYAYDQLGRVTTTDNSGTPGSPNVVLTNSYDVLSRRTGLSASIGGTADFVNAYQYDALGRTTRIEQTGQPGGNQVSQKRIDLSYNANGQFDTITRYADTAGTQLVATTAYAYDWANRLTNLTHAKGAATLADYEWVFDGAGRITSFTSPDGSTTYTYDDTNQLTGADHSYQTDESYTYDLNGNRTNTGYQVGTNNRLLSDGTYDYEYDSEGNRTKKTEIATGTVVEYSWDHRNRLTRVTYKDAQGAVTKTVDYAYDVDNLRIGKSVDDDGDGTAERRAVRLRRHARGTGVRWCRKPDESVPPWTFHRPVFRRRGRPGRRSLGSE